MPRLPDRWLKYSPYGGTIADRFIALKVPLSAHYTGIPEADRFTPTDAIETLSLGLIIDLTNTTRYYDPNEFTDNSVEYQKLFVKGHAIPEFSTVKRFLSIVKQFLRDPSSRGKYVGVHCTHGLNRTGYLVCAYLILELGYRAKDAIKLFNHKRGHEMERVNYLNSLYEMEQSRKTLPGPRYRQTSPRGDPHSPRGDRRSPRGDRHNTPVIVSNPDHRYRRGHHPYSLHNDRYQAMPKRTVFE
ncbi:RNA/RNP complex-1-interacting phosphatase homolog [Anopheles cruzii]|uniref:RNA/RNP complex-1-interacting phosphatase homolog n=1 Tax=Anopheles cruzii TaxID=68878 RepID=UPI0022EC8139|nr:RNA/RNP complex-1-interacting phosphatase homolog [Anopheles cruzii]